RFHWPAAPGFSTHNPLLCSFLFLGTAGSAAAPAHGPLPRRGSTAPLRCRAMHCHLPRPWPSHIPCPSLLFGDGELYESGASPLVFLIQGGGMNLSRVGENLLSSVCCARSLALLPPTPAPSCVEVPARAIVAATAGFDVTEVLKIT
uniref:Uncharacterized protein n=2 Tax=Aegilops tauschii subsp. strangulata TaxID=200361 RepID=A0A452ZR04_AEGTS